LFAYSHDLQLALLQATTDEMAGMLQKNPDRGRPRRECRFIVPYFTPSELDKPHDYVVYIFNQRTPATGDPRSKTSNDQHAGESEPSKMMIVRPDLLHEDRASESGALLPDAGINTFRQARFPDHYAGDGSTASHELGEDQIKW
jgi:creatinine amidohydrolase